MSSFELRPGEAYLMGAGPVDCTFEIVGSHDDRYTAGRTPGEQQVCKLNELNE